MRNETHHHPCTHEGCTKSFRSKVKLQNHMSTEHDGTNCGAFLCDQVITDDSQAHSRVQSLEGRFSLVSWAERFQKYFQCGKPFRLYATLLRHKRRNHLKSNHKICEYCNTSFPDNYKLQRHIRWDIFMHLLQDLCHWMMQESDLKSLFLIKVETFSRKTISMWSLFKIICTKR